MENNKKIDIGYNFIRFFAMFLILGHHLFTTFAQFHYPINPIIKNIIARGAFGWGAVGVALFFILSGALLIKNYNEQFNLRKFYLKRFIRIEIPQMVGFTCALALMYCIRPSIINIDFAGMIISLLGLNYAGTCWAHLNIKTIWVIGEWFTAVIILCYLLFPLFRKLFLNFRWISTIIIGLIFALNLKFEILSYHRGSFSITNGLMYFWMGMLFEQYKGILLKNKVFYSICAFLVFFYFLNPSNIFYIKYLPCFVLSLCLFVVLYRVNVSNFITEYICKYNYELYLVHHRVYILFLPALLTNKSNGVQSLIASLTVILMTFCFSEVLHKVCYILEQATISLVDKLKLNNINAFRGGVKLASQQYLQYKTKGGKQE